MAWHGMAWHGMHGMRGRAWRSFCLSCALLSACVCAWHGCARCKGVASQLARPRSAPGCRQLVAVPRCGNGM
eukprot:9003353-Lingulodinium_polyedra.AAC.1